MIRSTTIAIVIALVMAVSGCGGGSSAHVQPPPPTVPTINLITPGSVGAGSADLKITLTGSNFLGQPHNFSQAAWSANGSVTLLTTTFVSSTQLTVVVPTALLANPVTAQVLLETGDPMGDSPLLKSNSVSFSVRKPSPGAPLINSLSPSIAVAGSPDLNLIVSGSNFPVGAIFFSQVVWSANGKDTSLATNGGTTQLTALIPASLLKNPISAQVFVQILDQDGTPQYATNSLSFIVSSSASVSPAADSLGLKGTRQFVFTIAGSNTSAVWAVEEGASGGTITSGGFYTAPSNVGTFHVSATSVADASNSATAVVSVMSSGFSLTGNMSKARSGHTATLLANGKVLIVGGADGSAELFDPANGTFALTGRLNTPRFGATATLLGNGKVLVVGGFGPGANMLPRLNTAELYDPSTGTFSETGSMSAPRVGHTATLLNSGKVLIAGGTDSNAGGGAAIANAELYDPSNDTFSTTGSMLSERAQHTATLLLSGEVLIAGGWNGHAADAADDPPWDPLFAELYSPSTGTFRYSGTMSTTRIGHAAIRLSDGRVLMLGGIPALQNIHEQLPSPMYAELYEPATEIFSPVANVDLSQDSYTATLLMNGQLLIAGGEEGNVAVVSAELIDGMNQSLVATGSMVTARKGHTAARLNDGRVLVAGGVDNNGNVLATAELTSEHDSDVFEKRADRALPAPVNQQSR